MGLGVFGSILPMVLVLALFGWMGLSRLVRGQVLSLKEQQFIEAAQAIGVPTSRVLSKHLFPNVIAPWLLLHHLQLLVTFCQKLVCPSWALVFNHLPRHGDKY